MAKQREYHEIYQRRKERAQLAGFISYREQRKLGGVTKAVLPVGRAEQNKASQDKGYLHVAEEQNINKIIAEGLEFLSSGRSKVQGGLTSTLPGERLTPEEKYECYDLLKRCSDELVAVRAQGAETPHISRELHEEVKRRMIELDALDYQDVWGQMKALYMGLNIV